jgi:hypothetical protein
MAKVLQITSLTLGMVYAVFLGIFAFDAPFGVGMFIQLMPSLIVVAVSVLGYRSVSAGIALSAVTAVGFTLFFNSYRSVATFLLISGPIIIINVLFILMFISGKHVETSE